MNHHFQHDHAVNGDHLSTHSHGTASKIAICGSSVPMSVASYKEFLDSTQHSHDASIRYVDQFTLAWSRSRFASLGLAFGIAGSVFAAACGAAFKYVADKVDEERSKLLRANDSYDAQRSSKDVVNWSNQLLFISILLAL